MSKTTLTIAVSSRSLFNLEDGDKIWREQGQDAFDAYMRAGVERPLRPGVAFNLVRKLLALNNIAPKQERVKVLLLSRNSADASARVMSSVDHYKLPIETGVFCGGTDRFRFAKAFEADLFLSANPSDVITALKHGLAAATMLPFKAVPDDAVQGEALVTTTGFEPVMFALDGDAVIFSDESDALYREKGFEPYLAHERANKDEPLGDGPFKQLFLKLIAVQEELSKALAGTPGAVNPLRVALVTARGIQSNARVLRTLNSWGARLHEAVFCGGRPKGPVLEALGADIFFDDTWSNVTSALNSNISAACHVPHGVGGIQDSKALAELAKSEESAKPEKAAA